MGSLFGDEFEIKLKKPKIKDIKEKIDSAQEVVETTRVLKSNKLTIGERLAVIKDKVLRVLGKQKDKVLVIKDKETFMRYISKAIEVGKIAIDTETNNSLDPVTCKLMGLCLYVPGEKQVYVPINHRNYITKERLAWQLTEADCKEQLARLFVHKGGWIPDYEGQSYHDWYQSHVEIFNKDKDPIIFMHNGKFDYEVLKCTCDIEVKPDWDTIIAARLIDENEEAGLKAQYIKYIDSAQTKYDIEELFNSVQYADVDPEVFALYAATDAAMTYRLYAEHQRDILTADDHKKLYWVFNNIEMPIVIVTADMELRGVCIDLKLGERLKEKYNNQLSAIDTTIDTVLVELKPIIDAWAMTPGALAITKQFQPKKSKLSLVQLEERYPEIDKATGKRYRKGKAKAEQITDPINLASPIQLAILFYDILGCPEVSTKSPRGTGEEELKKLSEKLAAYGATKELDQQTDEEITEEREEAIVVEANKIVAMKAAAKLCGLILERRGIVKLITTYIDVIPTLAKHWPDGRIRFHLNSLGTDTGRYSSGGKIKYFENEQAVEVSGINIQNIPSHNKEIRMLFTADTRYHTVDITGNYFEVPETDEVETTDGWKFGKDLVVGDSLRVSDNEVNIINKIEKNNKTFYLYV